jgi:hypothetical protein
MDEWMSMRGSTIALIVATTSGLGDGNALLAHGTFFRLVRHDVQLEHRKILRIELNFAVAPVDDVPDTGECAFFPFDDIDDFEHGSARGNDVFDNETAFRGSNFESPSQLHRPSYPFGEEGPDTEHASDLGSDHDAADGGRDHDLDITVFEVFGDFSGEQMHVLWILEYFRTLKVLRAVQTGGELKMPFEESLGFAEDFENLFFGKSQCRYRGLDEWITKLRSKIPRTSFRGNRDGSMDGAESNEAGTSRERGSELIDPCGKGEVFFRQSSCAMRGKRERHLVPPDIDIGMVIGLLGEESDGIDKPHCPDEIFVLKHFGDFESLSSPPVKTVQPRLDLIFLQHIRHTDFPSIIKEQVFTTSSDASVIVC